MYILEETFRIGGRQWTGWHTLDCFKLREDAEETLKVCKFSDSEGWDAKYRIRFEAASA